MILSTLHLVLALSGQITAPVMADTTKAPPRPTSGPSTGSSTPSKPAPKPPKPVGDPVLKRRHPPV